MNSKSAIVWLGVALLLGFGAFWALKSPRRSNAASAATWLDAFDAGGVTSLHLQWPGKAMTLEPTGLGEVWLLKAGDDSTWPVAASRIRGALRLIAELKASPIESGAEAPHIESASATLGLTSSDGSARTLHIFDAALGGRAWVQVDLDNGSQLRAVEATFAKLFTPEGLLAWREAAPLVAAAGNTSRLTLESGDREVTLAKVKGQWALTVPLAAPVDSAVADEAALKLHSIAVNRFIDDGSVSSEAAGVNTPHAYLSVQADIGSADGQSRRVLVQEAWLGSLADAGGATLYCKSAASWFDPATSTTTPAWGPVLMVVDRKNIEKLTADPAAYISKLSVQTPAADVGGVRFFPIAPGSTELAVPSPSTDAAVTFQRGLNGWSMRDGQERLASPAEAQALDALVKLLCEERAETVTLSPPSKVSPLAGIVVTSPKGDPLEAVAIGVEGDRLAVKVGDIWRWYRSPGALAVRDWLVERGR